MKEMNEAFYKKVMDYRNSENNPYGQLLQLRVVDIKEGYGRIEIDLHHELMNSVGIVHGGLLFSIADSASGAAAASRGTKSVTLSGGLNIIRKSVGFQKLIAEAYVVQNGGTISVYDTKIHNENGDLIAEGMYTYFDLHRPLFEDEESTAESPEGSEKK